jgi:hypothetical protein
MKFFIILSLSFSFSVYSQANQDILDFKNGNTLKYECDGSGEANGIKFSIKYPRTYKVLPPNKLQVFSSLISKDSKVNISFEVTEFDIDYDSLIRVLSDEETIKQIALEEHSGIELTNLKTNLTIDGEYANCAEYIAFRNTTNGKLYIRIQTYTIIYDKIVITVSFGVKGTSKNNTLVLLDSYEQLFNDMMNSFVIVSKWQKNEPKLSSTIKSPLIDTVISRNVFGMHPRIFLRTFSKYLLWLLIGISLLYIIFRKPKK